MPFWAEIAVKAFLLLVAITALLGALIIFLMGALGQGAAISAPFNWQAAILAAVVWVSQTWMILCGWRSTLRWVEAKSDELKNRT